MIQITSFAQRETLMELAAERVAEVLNQAISQRGEGFAALSGGTTPAPAYAELARLRVNWPSVTFMLVDERFAPPQHPASNEGMLRRELMPALARGAKLLPLYSEATTTDEAAAAAEDVYRGKPIDIAVMGMGNDGHTASWFPGSPQLADALAPANPLTVMAVLAEGAAGTAARLTMTRAALDRAGEVLLLITGDEKRALLQDPRRGPLPVDALFDLSAHTQAIWAP